MLVFLQHNSLHKELEYIWPVWFPDMMMSSNGNIFHVTGSLWRESTSHRWIPLTKASDAKLWCFLWCAWTNSWANNLAAGDFRCHHTYYDVTVMTFIPYLLTELVPRKFTVCTVVSLCQKCGSTWWICRWIIPSWRTLGVSEDQGKLVVVSSMSHWASFSGNSQRITLVN